MSKSTNRHPAETYQLRDTRRLWHVPGPVQPPFGCEGCQQRDLCGGLQVETPIYNCLTFCRCVDPAACDNVCPKSMRHFVARSQEVRGFELDNVPRAPEIKPPTLPAAVPLIYHGFSRKVPLRVAAAALPLAEMITRTDGALRFQTRAELFGHFKLDPDCKLVLSGTDEDPAIERWWRLADRETVIRGLHGLGVTAITSPNYSLFSDVPRQDNLYNMKRIALIWSEFQREGLPAALHVNARTNRDWDRWTDFIGLRPEASTLAFEFGTGAGSKTRMDWHVEQLSQLAQRVARPLTLIVRGGSTALTTLRSAFQAVTYIDTAPFVKTQRRQRAILVGTKLMWQSAPTAPGDSLDELLHVNIALSAAHVVGREQAPVATLSAVSAPAETPTA